MFGKRKRKVGDIPTSSMADIAFLLLIFFLVTTTISADKGILFNLPQKMEDIEQVKVKGVINIIINDENRILFGKKGQEQEVTPRDIKNKLNEISREKGIVGEDTVTIVSLKATENADYAIYIDVLDQIKSAKVRRISLAQE